MAGLFGLFGGKKNQDSSQPEKKKGAYFLDSDSAKTFGDIDYMRSSKVVKRTFPKTAGNKGEFEQVQSVSALGKMKVDGVSVNGATPASTNGSMNSTNSTPSTPKNDEEVAQRRKTDTSMDMFRNMAKDMKKR